MKLRLPVRTKAEPSKQVVRIKLPVKTPTPVPSKRIVKPLSSNLAESQAQKALAQQPDVKPGQIEVNTHEAVTPGRMRLMEVCSVRGFSFGIVNIRSTFGLAGKDSTQALVLVGRLFTHSADGDLDDALKALADRIEAEVSEAEDWEKSLRGEEG
jgi:hypothetical protein